MAAGRTNRNEGKKIVTISYRGESPMWVDVAGGQLQVAIGSYQSFATVQCRAASKPLGWAREVPVWVKLPVDMGITLD